MDVMKKKFLRDVRNNLKSIGMPNDKIDLIVSEVEVIYNIELERGKSHTETVKNKFGGPSIISERYGKIFGYSQKGPKSNSNKRFRNREQNISGNLKNGYDYVRTLNKQAIGRNKIIGNSKGFTDKVDSALMSFIELMINN